MDYNARWLRNDPPRRDARESADQSSDTSQPMRNSSARAECPQVRPVSVCAVGDAGSSAATAFSASS